MDEPKSRHQEVWEVYVNLERSLLYENLGRAGFFKHILGNLAMGIVSFGTSEEERRSFEEAAESLLDYRRLLQEHPEFRRGELTREGYFNNLEGRTIEGEGDKKAILDWKKYVDYARKKLT